MKIDFHIQPEQFEYIGFEYDQKEGLSDEAIKGALSDYNRAKGQIKGKEGMSKAITPADMQKMESKQMNGVVDKMLLGQGVENGTEIYEAMNPYEKYAVQVLKRAISRLEAKNSRQ